MTVRAFVDSNVLIYTSDSRDLRKMRQAQNWTMTLWRRKCGVISPQVLNEYYVGVTTKLTPGIERDVARRDVQRFLTWQVVQPDAMVYRTAFAIEDRFRFSWWDSLIVAAAKRGDCSHLVTEDLQHGQDISGLKVIDPFQIPPEELLTA